MNKLLNPKSCNIYIIRHAESKSNAGLRISSPQDNPITIKGQQQAQLLALKIKKLGIEPDIIVCSPYIRTYMTAKPTINNFPYCQIETWEEIHEFNYLNSTRCANTTQEERKPFVEKYWKDLNPEYNDGGNAESFCDFINRITATIDKINTYQDKTIILFSHGQFMAMLNIYIANSNATVPELMAKFRNADRGRTIENCEIIKLF